MRVWGGKGEGLRTCAGEVPGVVTAVGVGVAGVDGGNEEGEDGYEGGVHGCDWMIERVLCIWKVLWRGWREYKIGLNGKRVWRSI